MAVNGETLKTMMGISESKMEKELAGMKKMAKSLLEYIEAAEERDIDLSLLEGEIRALSMGMTRLAGNKSALEACRIMADADQE